MISAFIKKWIKIEMFWGTQWNTYFSLKRRFSMCKDWSNHENYIFFEKFRLFFKNSVYDFFFVLPLRCNFIIFSSKKCSKTVLGLTAKLSHLGTWNFGRIHVQIHVKTFQNLEEIEDIMLNCSTQIGGMTHTFNIGLKK